VKVVLSFDGEHVTGFYYSVGGFEGPNGLREGTLIGRRTSIGCELYEADGTMWQATTCGSKGFQGQIVSVRGIPKQSEVTSSTVGMFVRDTGWITRLGEEEARRDRRINWLTQRLDGAGTPQSRFRAAIEIDSFSRHFRASTWAASPSRPNRASPGRTGNGISTAAMRGLTAAPAMSAG